MKNHEKAFSDIKNYYNDITLNNLALINSLKDQVEKMKKDSERLEKQLAETQAENRRLQDPLAKAKEQVAELQRQLSNYERDKASLAVSVALCQWAGQMVVVVLFFLHTECQGSSQSTRIRTEELAMGA